MPATITPTKTLTNTPTKTLTNTPTVTVTTTKPISTIPKLYYNMIVEQNNLLTDTIQKDLNINTTNNQKFNYQSNDILFLNGVNNILFYIYYFIVLIVCYYLFYDKNFTLIKKGVILFIFAIYPYVFNLITYYLVKIVMYLYSIINFTAYEYN